MMESTKCTPNMIVPESLTKDNYDVWKIFMKSYLLGKGLWDILGGSECKPEPTNYLEFKAWSMRNGEVLHAILISCGEEVLFHIMEIDSAKDAWDHLATIFQQNTNNGKNKLPSEAKTSMSEESESALEVESNTTSEEDKFCSKGETNFQTEIMPPCAGTSSVDQEMAAADKLALYRAVYSTNWNLTKSLLEKYPDTYIDAILSPRWGTVLHVAVRIGNLHFVKQLLEFMTQDAIDIAKTNDYYFPTPLDVAAACGFTKIAQVLVRKSKDPSEILSRRCVGPVISACVNSHKDTTRYLYYKVMTRKEALIEGNGTKGATLVNSAIVSEMYDIAVDLLRNYPWLSITKDLLGWTTIKWLAIRPNAFASGGHYSIWQQWIHSIPSIKSIHNKKTTRVEALEVLKIVCSQLASLDEPKLRDMKVDDSIFDAAEFGNVEIVFELAKINPEFLLRERDEKNILSNAILLRQEKIFSYLCGKRGYVAELIPYSQDSNNNCPLHYAGMLAPPSQQGKIPSAALQMQHDLQWFREVEEITPPSFKHRRNKQGLTPRELFTKEHTELLKKGEKWMKDTANSCMIVATLIATVTFAAVFTVPGGNDQTWGFPIFLRRNLFLLFIISDALSLLSSSTSVLMFVSIYTSCYAEEDFLKSLPKRLVIGFSTLFFSMATMMMAFCTTLFLILGKHYKWAAILISFFASVPVSLFIWLQFPLFLDMICSTYGQGLFDMGKKTLKS